jgi:hypothetical protein
MVGVRCGRRHAEEGGGEARVQPCHAEEDGVGGLVGSSAGRGAWPAWVGGGQPCVAAHARAGGEGWGLVGVAAAGQLPWAGPSV